MTTTWDVLTASSVLVGNQVLLRASDATTLCGSRMIAFRDGNTEVQVSVFRDGSSIVALLESDRFLYGCSKPTVDESFKDLESYIAARDSARKQVAS